MRKTFARKLTVKEAIEILEYPDDYYMFDRIEARNMAISIMKEKVDEDDESLSESVAETEVNEQNS